MYDFDIYRVLFLTGFLSLLGIVAWLIFRPVTRDRVLFGRKAYPFFLFSVVSLLAVVLTLCLFADIFDVSSNYILRPNDSQDIVEATTGKIEDSTNKVEDSTDKKPKDSEGQHLDLIWAVISQFADPGNLPSSNPGGKIIALACAIAGIVCLSGLVISSGVNFLSHRSKRWRQGTLYYKHFFNNYVIIIGVNDQTAAIIKRSLARDDVDYVLIQTRQNVEKMRMRLELDLDRDEEDRIVFYFAERTSQEDIAMTRPDRAIEIYVLGEDADFESEQDHDAYNIACLENISNYLKAQQHTGLKKRVHVNFEYQSTFTAFKSTHIYNTLDRNVEFLPFNIHEIWAKKVLVDNFAVVPVGQKGEVRVQHYLPLDSPEGIRVENPTSNIKNASDNFDPHTVHLIVVGMSHMGCALAVQAALIAHYPNFHRRRHLRTTITFIDERASVEGMYFRSRLSNLFDISRYRCVTEDHLLDEKGKIIDYGWIDPLGDKNSPNDNHTPNDNRYSHLQDDSWQDKNFMDIEWQFIEGNVASDKVRKYLTKVTADPNRYTTIAICLNHSQKAIASALYLPEEVYQNVMQMLVYQQNTFDLINLIATSELDWRRYSKLRPFGMVERSYNEDPYDNGAAKILNYMYSIELFRQNLDADGYDFVRVKDLSEVRRIDTTLVSAINQEWNKLGIVKKQSNIDMVESIPTKLRSLGIDSEHLENFDLLLSRPQVLASMSKSEHTRWATEQLIMGFRPLNKDDEWQPFLDACIPGRDRLSDELAELKKELKSKRRAHLDICSNTTLRMIDPGVYRNDINVICYIPQLLKYSNWVNVMKMADPSVWNSIAAVTQRLFFSNIEGIQPVTTVKYKIGENDKGLMDYWIMDTVVTQGQWGAIMGIVPVDKYRDDKKPMINVSLDEIRDFIRVLGKRTGLTFRLPTLDEWRQLAEVEFANIDIESSDIWVEHPGRGPQRVREGKRTAEGIYDLLGNVWEWTCDMTPCQNSEEHCCGGGWMSQNKVCDMDDELWRVKHPSNHKSDDLGFRLVWDFDIRHLFVQHDDESISKSNGEIIKRLMRIVPTQYCIPLKRRIHMAYCNWVYRQRFKCMAKIDKFHRVVSGWVHKNKWIPNLKEPTLKCVRWTCEQTHAINGRPSAEQVHKELEKAQQSK